MEIFGIGSTELLIIMLIAVIVLGPERLARNAREAGKFVRNAKAYFASLSDEMKNELDILDQVKDLKDDLTIKK